MLSIGASIPWVNSPRKSQEPPSSGTQDGLAGVLLTENPRLVFVTLALDNLGSFPQASAARIMQTLRSTLSGMVDGTFEREYVEEDGALHVSRSTEATNLDRCIPVSYLLHRAHFKQLDKAHA